MLANGALSLILAVQLPGRTLSTAERNSRKDSAPETASTHFGVRPCQSAKHSLSTTSCLFRGRPGVLLGDLDNQSAISAMRLSWI